MSTHPDCRCDDDHCPVHDTLLGVPPPADGRRKVAATRCLCNTDDWRRCPVHVVNPDG